MQTVDLNKVSNAFPIFPNIFLVRSPQKIKLYGNTGNMLLSNTFWDLDMISRKTRRRNGKKKNANKIKNNLS